MSDFKCWDIRRWAGCIVSDSNMLPLRNSACHVCWKGMFARHKSDWAEGFFFFSFLGRRSRLIWVTPAKRREVRHMFKDTYLVIFWKNRVNKNPAIRKTHEIAETRLSNRSLSPPEIVLTLTLILERYRCGWRKRKKDSLWSKLPPMELDVPVLRFFSDSAIIRSRHLM